MAEPNSNERIVSPRRGGVLDYITPSCPSYRDLTRAHLDGRQYGRVGYLPPNTPLRCEDSRPVLVTEIRPCFQSSRLAGGRPRHTIPSNHSMIQVPSTHPRAMKKPHTNQTSIAFAVIIVNIIFSFDRYRRSHRRAKCQIAPLVSRLAAACRKRCKFTPNPSAFLVRLKTAV